MAGNRFLDLTGPDGMGPGYYRGDPPGLLGQGSGRVNITGRESGGGGQWQPTVVSLVALVIGEIIVFGLLRWFFREVHGG